MSERELLWKAFEVNKNACVRFCQFLLKGWHNYEADDLAMDTICKLVKGAYPIHNGKFMRLFIVAARSVLYDHKAREARRDTHSYDALEDGESLTHLAIDHRIEEEAIFADEVSRLPGELSIHAVATDMGYSQAEIASRLGLNRVTYSNRIQRHREAVSKKFHQCHDWALRKTVKAVHLEECKAEYCPERILNRIVEAA